MIQRPYVTSIVFWLFDNSFPLNSLLGLLSGWKILVPQVMTMLLQALRQGSILSRIRRYIKHASIEAIQIASWKIWMIFDITTDWIWGLGIQYIHPKINSESMMLDFSETLPFFFLRQSFLPRMVEKLTSTQLELRIAAWLRKLHFDAWIVMCNPLKIS